MCLLPTTYLLGFHRVFNSLSYIYIIQLPPLSPLIDCPLSFSVVFTFSVLEKQNRKPINLTISTKDKYKNIPAVTVKIQSWTRGSADTERPIYSPMKAVRALTKFIRMAVLTESPELKSTAKSPGVWVGRRGCHHYLFKGAFDKFMYY